MCQYFCLYVYLGVLLLVFECCKQKCELPSAGGLWALLERQPWWTHHSRTETCPQDWTCQQLDQMNLWGFKLKTRSCASSCSKLSMLVSGGSIYTQNCILLVSTSCWRHQVEQAVMMICTNESWPHGVMLLNEPTKLLLLGQLALNTFLLSASTQIMCLHN